MKNRTLLWVFPLLAATSYALVTLSVQALEKKEQAHQVTRTETWTTSLQEYQRGVMSGGLGMRKGEMILDADGRIWVVGGPSGLDGLHVFDGSRWTSYEGSYQDLAVSPRGQVWAVGEYGGIVVIDGGKLTTYSTSDFGFEEWSIEQVEVDSNGRIWVSIDIWEDIQAAEIDILRGRQVAEIVFQQGKPGLVFSHTEFIITDGGIVSLDADNTGRIWAAVQYYAGKTGQWGGLNVFDGQEWQHMLDQPGDYESFQRTRADKQGRIWTFPEGGNMLRYDGMGWETIPGMCCINDFAFDDQGRVWGWGDHLITSFDTDGFTTLTPENSGLDEGQVFGVVVDNLDRLWVGSASGVSMVSVESALTIPDQKTLRSHESAILLLDRLFGLEWFLPALFGFLWIAVWVDALPAVLLVAGLGLFAKLCLPGDYIILAAIGSFPGMLLGLVGGLIDRGRSKRGKQGKPWGYILAVIGMVIGIGLGLGLLIVTSP